MVCYILTGADGSWVSLLSRHNPDDSMASVPSRPHPFHDKMQVSAPEQDLNSLRMQSCLAIAQEYCMHRSEEGSRLMSAATS